MSNPTDPNLGQPAAAPDAQAAPQAPHVEAPQAPQAPQYEAPPVAAQPYSAPASQGAAAPQPAPYGAPAPQYAAPQQYGAPTTTPPTNTMSVISMISSIVGFFTFGLLCLLGVILGHISLGQIKRNNEGGKGFAVTGLVVGYIGIIGWVIALIVMLIFFAVFGAALTDASFMAKLDSMS